MRQVSTLILASALIAAPLVTTSSAQPERPIAAEGNHSINTQPRAADWAVYMEAPAHYLSQAKELLQQGRAAEASAELKRANNFIHFQQRRLEAASRQIEALTADFSSGKGMDAARLDQVADNVLKAIEQKYAMVPINILATPIFEDINQIGADKTRVRLPLKDSSGVKLNTDRDLFQFEL